MQLHMQSLQAAWNAVYMLQKIWLPLRARTLLGAPGIALGAKSLLVSHKARCALGGCGRCSSCAPARPSSRPGTEILGAPVASQGAANEGI